MNTPTTQLWDLPVRLFHWSLLPLILAQWLLAENSEAIQDHLAGHGISFDAMLWHARLGFVLLFLLLFRIIWGFVGSSSARFCHFVRGPSTVIAYAKTLLQRDTPAHAGHNPLGGWMVMLLLTLIGLQIFSGMFLSDDIALEGPLYAMVSEDTVEWIEEVHELTFNLILLAVVLHVSAILFYAKYKKQNLLRPMITGKTPLSLQNQHPYSPFKPLTIAIVCALVVWYLTAAYW